MPGEALMSFMGFLGAKGSWLKTPIKIICISGTFAANAGMAQSNKYGEEVELKLVKPIHITKESWKKTSFF